MSIDGIWVCASGNFTKSSNHINKNREHPKYFTAIRWDRFVLKEEDLNDKNWLYVGDDSEEDKNNKLFFLKLHKGWVLILE